MYVYIYDSPLRIFRTSYGPAVHFFNGKTRDNILYPASGLPRVFPTFKANFVDAGLPVPENPAEDCLPDNLMNPEFAKCNGQNCLYEQRNVYRFSKEFERVTGFNHVGFDWVSSL